MSERNRKDNGMGVCSTIMTDLNLGLQLCFISKSQKMGPWAARGLLSVGPDDENSVYHFPLNYCSVCLSLGTKKEEG